MKMLVATDGSPHAIKAAEVAARLAGEMGGAEVVLLNVGYIPAIAYRGPGGGMIDLGTLEKGLEEASRVILDDSAKPFGSVNARLTRVYRRGDPAGEILRASAERQVDLIVVGCRGLGRVGGLILGSVSERVLHGALIPVLIVR